MSGQKDSKPGAGLPSRRLALHRQPKRRPKGAVKADINVTPLVDVVLVLLIIFMVVTPMLSRGVSVNLPLTRHHDKKADNGKDIIVSVASSGDIYVNTEKVALAQVPSRIEDEKRKHPEKDVFLKADNRIHYGRAREVMEAIHKTGVEDIELGTDERKEDK